MLFGILLYFSKTKIYENAKQNFNPIHINN